MAHCATRPCPAQAVVIYTARRGTGDVRYRAALTCDTHRAAVRRWVATAGPAVHETPLTPDPNALAPAQGQPTLF